MQKDAVLTEVLPFCRFKLRDKLFVVLLVPHRTGTVRGNDMLRSRAILGQVCQSGQWVTRENSKSKVASNNAGQPVPRPSFLRLNAW